MSRTRSHIGPFQSFFNPLTTVLNPFSKVRGNKFDKISNPISSSQDSNIKNEALKKMLRNSLCFFSPSNPSPGQVMPANIDHIEVNADKSIIISKSIDFPGEEIFRETYLIEKVSHIEIALRVLSGVISAKDGTQQLCDIENLFSHEADRPKYGFQQLFDLEGLFKSEPDRFSLGMLLLSLIVQSLPDNKKIRYIDPVVERNVKMLVGLEDNKHHFKW